MHLLYDEYVALTVNFNGLEQLSVLIVDQQTLYACMMSLTCDVNLERDNAMISSGKMWLNDMLVGSQIEQCTLEFRHMLTM